MQADEDLEWTFMINTSESHFHISSVWGNNFFFINYLFSFIYIYVMTNLTCPSLLFSISMGPD